MGYTKRPLLEFKMQTNKQVKLTIAQV